MTVRRIPVRNAMTNQPELLEGDVIDVLPNDHSMYVDRAGKTYDPSKGVRMTDLPQSGVIQLPRTTWYGFDPKPITDDLPIVGYMIGPDGCVPIYERRNHAHTTNRRPRADDLGSSATPGGRRNWRARKAARAAGALAVPDAERGSSSGTE
jgi:hypothetical protein